MTLVARWRTEPGENIVRETPVSYVVQETPSGTVEGQNTVFTLDSTPIDPSLVEVYRNGLRQLLGATFDYTLSGPEITFRIPPLTGSLIRVSYWTRRSP